MNVNTLRSSRRHQAMAAAVVIALIAVLWWIFGSSKTEPPPPPPVPVGVVRAEQRDVAHMASGIGTVESLHNVTLRPQVEGVLAEVLFKEGQMVRKGDLLARIDDRPFAAALAQAQAEKARNQAQLRAAEQDLNRYENLVKEEAISRQTVEQQQGTVGELRAAVNASDAAIAAAQVQMSFTRITAPVSGRIGLRRVDPGNLVRAADADGLVTVTQIAPISVLFSLPQTLVPSIQPLLKLEGGALVAAFDRDNGTRLAEGRLSMIDNQIDATTGTIKLRANFDNADGSLWPGQFVTVRLQIGMSAKATVVSPRAVKQGLDGPFVFRVANGKAEVVPVTVGHVTDREAVIVKGVAPGETIVFDGQSRLKDGSTVKIIEGSSGASVAGETP